MTEIAMNEKKTNKKNRCLDLWGRFHQHLTPAAPVTSGVSRHKGENQKEKTKQNKNRWGTLSTVIVHESLAQSVL